MISENISMKSMVEDKNSYSFDSFGGPPDTILIQQLPNPKIFHNQKLQDTNSKIRGVFCSYFFI